MSEDNIVVENKQPKELLDAMTQMADSLTKQHDPSAHVWLQIFCSVANCSVANCYNSNREATVKWADFGLEEYNKRFGTKS